MNVSEWNSLDDIWNHMESYEYPWDIDDTSIYGCIMDVYGSIWNITGILLGYSFFFTGI